MRAYLRSLNPQLPRDVWILQAGGLVNMFGNGVIGPFLIIYLHNVRGLSLGVAGLVVATGSLAAFASGFVGGALADRLGPSCRAQRLARDRRRRLCALPVDSRDLARVRVEPPRRGRHRLVLAQSIHVAQLADAASNVVTQPSLNSG